MTERDTGEVLADIDAAPPASILDQITWVAERYVREARAYVRARDDDGEWRTVGWIDMSTVTGTPVGEGDVSPPDEHQSRYPTRYRPDEPTTLTVSWTPEQSSLDTLALFMGMPNMEELLAPVLGRRLTYAEVRRARDVYLGWRRKPLWAEPGPLKPVRVRDAVEALRESLPRPRFGVEVAPERPWMRNVGLRGPF